MPLSLSGPNGAPLLGQDNMPGQSLQPIIPQTNPLGLEFNTANFDAETADAPQDPIDLLKASVTDQTQAAADLLAQWLEQDEVAAENG